MEFPGGQTRVPFNDAAKNAFAKTNLFYSRSAFLAVQDPTVLGFKLFFHFDNIESPLLYGVNQDIQQAPVNTAAHYLKTIGDQQRLYYLEKFLYLLSNINKQCPWYFQTLAGLKEAWKQDYSQPLLKDKALEIECLESIDLRMTAVMDLYRKACFDWVHRREVVPKNLRQFKMDVYLYEQRWINNPNAIATVEGLPDVNAGYGGNIQGEAAKLNAEIVNRLTGKDETRNDPSTVDVNILEGVPMSTTRNLFHFDFCHFDFAEPGHLETISNMEGAETKQKMKIRYEYVEEVNMYNYWTAKDPICDAYVGTLDREALDSTFDAPGEPPTLAQQTDNSRAPRDLLRNQAGETIGMGGDTADLQAEGDKLKAEVAKKQNTIIKAAQQAAQAAQDRLAAAVEGAKRIPDNLLENFQQQVVNEVGAAVGTRLLGNVNEGSIGKVLRALEQGNLGAALNQNPFEDIFDNPSKANTIKPVTGQNIADGSASLNNVDPPNSPTGNIFD